MLVLITALAISRDLRPHQANGTWTITYEFPGTVSTVPSAKLESVDIFGEIRAGSPGGLAPRPSEDWSVQTDAAPAVLAGTPLLVLRCTVTLAAAVGDVAEPKLT